MCGRASCDKPNCTWSEAWRAECEARWAMRLPREKRAAYYEDVKKKRGEESLSKLIEDVREQWKKSCS